MIVRDMLRYQFTIKCYYIKKNFKPFEITVYSYGNVLNVAVEIFYNVSKIKFLWNIDYVKNDP